MLRHDAPSSRAEHVAHVAQDMSPLENMHTSSMFKLLYGTENLRFAAHMSIESLNLMRSSVIDLILGKPLQHKMDTMLNGNSRLKTAIAILANSWKTGDSLTSQQLLCRH